MKTRTTVIHPPVMGDGPRASGACASGSYQRRDPEQPAVRHGKSWVSRYLSRGLSCSTNPGTSGIRPKALLIALTAVAKINRHDRWQAAISQALAALDQVRIERRSHRPACPHRRMVRRPATFSNSEGITVHARGRQPSPWNVCGASPAPAAERCGLPHPYPASSVWSGAALPG